MTHALYDIWEEETPQFSTVPLPYPWRLQLVNYVAKFQKKIDAEVYAAAVKRERARVQLAK